MSEILDHIHQDHRNMMTLLDLLEHDLRDLASGDDHDYSLMANIIDYFNHYPAHYHHPFEDQLFDWIGNERETLRAEIDNLREEHQSQAKFLARLSTLIQGVQTGHMVPRAEIVDQMTQFIKLQREHIQTEEGHLLKEAHAILAGLHLAEIPVPDRARLDPLFGKNIDPNYEIIAIALGHDHDSKAAGSSVA